MTAAEWHNTYTESDLQSPSVSCSSLQLISVWLFLFTYFWSTARQQNKYVILYLSRLIKMIASMRHYFMIVTLSDNKHKSMLMTSNVLLCIQLYRHLHLSEGWRQQDVVPSVCQLITEATVFLHNNKHDRISYRLRPPFREKRHFCPYGMPTLALHGRPLSGWQSKQELYWAALAVGDWLDRC